LLSGLTDEDLVKIDTVLFQRHEEFIKNRVFGAGEQEQKVWQQEYDLLCAKVLRWYVRAQTRIGKRIHAHFIAMQELDNKRLLVHVFPYGLFPTREAAKRHRIDCFCSTTVEDHGDAGLVVVHNGTEARTGSRRINWWLKRAAGNK
jgi:hypothetical protein